jgi:WD40 repeat protein
LFLDGRTYEPLFAARLPGEARWHPTDPDVMLYVRDNRIGRFDVRSGKDHTIVTIEGYSEFRLMSEGNFSYDGKRVAVAAKDPEGRIVAFAYDLRKQVKYPDIELGAMKSIDWVSISALGQYVVVNGNHNGRNHRGGLDQTRVFDLQGRPVGPLWENYGEPSHYDLTVDQSGEEVAVGTSKSGLHSGKLIMRRLRDGLITVVSPEPASHTSARNYRRPGWAYATCGDDRGVFRNEIIAVKLDGSLHVERLCHMHLVRAGYESEGHASVSPDGTRVIWNSNWDDKEGDISVYVAEIRPRDQ